LFSPDPEFSTTEQQKRYTVIFANGDQPNPETARWHAERAELLIAANGGTHHALALELVPDTIIGDLDSLDQALKNELCAAGTQFLEHPPAKDETDLELALHYAVEQGAEPIIILAALGGRVDQTIANILLLTLPLLSGRDVRLIDGSQTAFIVREEARIVGQPGDTVSLIPLAGPARGVSTRGLAYALTEGSLPFGPALGVSNEMDSSEAWVQVREGFLLCVHLSSVNERHAT
jgi:thiamine pyrophosphokinase